MTVERIPIEGYEQWLALRQPVITASDVATVCGEGAFASAAVLFAEKKGLRPPLIDSPTLKKGRWGEASAFEALSETFPEMEARRAKIFLRDLNRGMGATPDGFAVSPDRRGTGIIQAKVINWRVFQDKWLLDPAESVELGDAIPPRQYHLQTLMEMMLADSKWGMLVVLINSEYQWAFRTFDIYRDPELEDFIERKVREFHDLYLIPNIMPPLDLGRDADLVRLLYPRDDGTEIDLTTDNRALTLVEELTETQAGRKRLALVEDVIKTELEAKLGGHSYGRLADGRRISWKLQHRKAYTAPAADFRVLRVLKALSEDR